MSGGRARFADEEQFASRLQRVRGALSGTRFGDVRWLRETGSTNADVLELGRQGEPEGIVAVADHQTAGRGRQGRIWQAPPEASLLMSVLLRPPAGVAGATTMATAVALSEAVEVVTGVIPGLKWPNDLVLQAPTAGAVDRKLAGILAEADWPAGSHIADGWREPGATDRVVVVVGVGLNVNWPTDLPEELADLAVAINHITGHDVDREAVLVAFLQRLDHHYTDLLANGSESSVFEQWRQRSATLGRRVRVDLGADDVEGVAVDVTSEGHLVVDTDTGERRIFAVGDVVHLRPLPR